MSIAIQKIYADDPVNSKRKDTDVFFIDDTAENKYSGILENAMRFVENTQLLDVELWKRFVTQYKERTDSADRGWRGVYWGKMMRGAAFVCSYTKNEELYNVITDTVKDMLTAEDGLGRISTYEEKSETAFSEFDGWDIWCRKYVLLGMQYYLEICKDNELKKEIISSLCRQVDYIMTKIGKPEEGKKRITMATRNWRGLNSTSLLEPVVRLYDLTGEKKYLDFAEYIISEGGTSVFNLFEMALEDTTDPYQYPITKAYEMMSCFEGALEYYRATGIEKYKTLVLNFARRVMNSDVSIIGCCGTTGESFDHSSARQTDKPRNDSLQETCVTVTWMKFCLQLLSLTGDVKFADCFETSLYNAYLGSFNTERASSAKAARKHFNMESNDFIPFDSYSPLLGGTRGNIVGGGRPMADNHYYGCCACIGAAGIGLVHKAAVMLTEKGIALNLYYSGVCKTMTPSGKSLALECETEYPAKGRIKIKVCTESEEEFEIKLRIPAWSEETKLCVCGEKAEAVNGYTALDRTWKNGDIIELELDMRAKLLRPVSNPRDLIITEVVWGYDYLVPRVVVASEDAEYHAALRYGPLVLARDARLGEDILEKIDFTPDTDDHVELAPSDKASFDKIVEFTAETEKGDKITLVDFSSAGKTWSEDSKYVCWLPTTKKYSK